MSLSKFIFPEEIFFIKSSDPNTSAPLFFASFSLFSSHNTATLIFFPLPFGSSIAERIPASEILFFLN